MSGNGTRHAILWLAIACHTNLYNIVACYITLRHVEFHGTLKQPIFNNVRRQRKISKHADEQTINTEAGGVVVQHADSQHRGYQFDSSMCHL